MTKENFINLSDEDRHIAIKSMKEHIHSDDEMYKWLVSIGMWHIIS